MDANGGQLKQMTEDLPLWAGCTWSPDGKQIAYAAGVLDKEGVDIFTIDVDTENINRLTNMGIGFRSGNPAWSPDGNCIAYSVIEVDEWPNPANGFKIIFSDSTLYLIDIQGGIVEPLKKTTGLSSDHVPVWISEDFFPFPQMQVNRQYPGENLNNIKIVNLCLLNFKTDNNII